MNNIIYKTAPNGLTMCLIKKSGYIEKQVMLAFGCGSANLSFKSGDKDVSVPVGTAHFVEHKLFDKKHGDAFAEFTALGANVNAFTGLDITAYYFTCSENLPKCLSLLAQMAVNPYFTQKGIDKELGIISGEITMYDDNPDWQAYFNMLGSLYDEHPIGYPITGGISDIRQITPDTLSLFYDSFYTADNAILIAVGDIDEAAFFEQATTEFTLPHKSPAAVTTTQSTGIRQAYVKKYMPIATPVFSIGFKENSFDLSPISRTVYSEVLTDILIGSGSVLFEKLYNNGLCTQPLGIDYICGKDYGISTVFGTSANPQRLLTLLHKEVENYLSYGISEQTLKRIIEKNKGKLMQNMDSIDFCCNFVSDNFVKSIKTLDFCDKYDSINNDELMHRLKEHFKPDNLCLSEIIPL